MLGALLVASTLQNNLQANRCLEGPIHGVTRRGWVRISVPIDWYFPQGHVTVLDGFFESRLCAGQVAVLYQNSAQQYTGIRSIAGDAGVKHGSESLTRSVNIIAIPKKTSKPETSLCGYRRVTAFGRSPERRQRTLVLPLGPQLVGALELFYWITSQEWLLNSMSNRGDSIKCVLGTGSQFDGEDRGCVQMPLPRPVDHVAATGPMVPSNTASQGPASAAPAPEKIAGGAAMSSSGGDDAYASQCRESPASAIGLNARALPTRC
ncbi:hypothetical protein F9C11_20920 [Amycolatopsis sp. VS8301801F10]|uniref:hypothetical protein n=1 Tax=Amycolatopsis sp. VS8301801F10 TaxID=2652442 RepID=UPI0038FC912F